MATRAKTKILGMNRLLLSPMNRQLLLYSTSAAAATAFVFGGGVNQHQHHPSLSSLRGHYPAFVSGPTTATTSNYFNGNANNDGRRIQLQQHRQLYSSLSDNEDTQDDNVEELAEEERMKYRILSTSAATTTNASENLPTPPKKAPGVPPMRLLETSTVLEFGTFKDYEKRSILNPKNVLYDTTVVIGRKDSLQHVVMDEPHILNDILLGKTIQDLPKPMAQTMMNVMDDKRGGSTSTLLLRSDWKPEEETTESEGAPLATTATTTTGSDDDTIASNLARRATTGSAGSDKAHRLSFGGLPIKDVSRNNHPMSVHTLTRKVRALCPSKSRTRVIVLVPDEKPKKGTAAAAANEPPKPMRIGPLALAIAKAFPVFSMKTKKVVDPVTVAAGAAADLVATPDPLPEFNPATVAAAEAGSGTFMATSSDDDDDSGPVRKPVIIADSHTPEDSKPRSVYVVFARESDGSIIEDEESLTIARSVARGVRLTSRIVDTPPEMMNVDDFAHEAQKVADKFPDKVKMTEIHGEDLRPYGGVYAVGKGAACPPRMVILEYNPNGISDEPPIDLNNIIPGQQAPSPETSPSQVLSTSSVDPTTQAAEEVVVDKKGGKKKKKKKKPVKKEEDDPEKMETIAFVGKGIIYDSGGLSLKPKNLMPGMKRDVGGAAAVLGGFYAAAEMGVKKRIFCILCLAENAIGPHSMRNDDILTLYSGKTVEINNTDAEGRLLLSDGVAHATRHIPNLDLVIDMATLTGAQHITTGKKHAGIMGNSVKLEQRTVRAGMISGDLCFPILYAPDLLLQEFDSKVADMRNSAKLHNNAGPSCAGHFIQTHLHDNYKGGWLHIDMSGPNFFEQRGTGYGVGLFLGLVGAPGFR